jgi:hypothetical protein
VFRALEPAAQLSPLYWWFFAVVLAVYVPGMCSTYYQVHSDNPRVVHPLHAHDCAATEGHEQGQGQLIRQISFMISRTARAANLFRSFSGSSALISR